MMGFSASRTCNAIVLLLSVIPTLILADESTHKYAKGEDVNFWVHKVGPYANPQEAYNYYSLPYCAPENEHHPKEAESSQGSLFNKIKSVSIGEYLGGHALRHSGHTLKFASNAAVADKCTIEKPLSNDDAMKFTKAAENLWFYQMYIDDLPIWGMVGEMMAPLGPNGEANKDENAPVKPHVYTYRTITIYYNDNRIIKVDLLSEISSLKEVKAGASLSFTTEFVWKETTEMFHSRFDRYLDHVFFKHQIHWFSLFNSFMMVLFLVGLVALILVRTLRRDIARYAINDGAVDEMIEEGASILDENGKPLLDHDHLASAVKGAAAGGMPNEDSGWKQVNGDVFRAPSLLPLVAAILGTGSQLIILTVGVSLFTVAGPLHGEVHEDRGELQHAVLYCYCFSSVVAGYTSGSYFKTYSPTKMVRGKPSAAKNDSQWQLAMLLTVLFLPTITVGILSFLNGIALVYGTVNYVPFLVIIKVFLVWVFISVPLGVVGTMFGRHAKAGKGGKGDAIANQSDFPCRVNAIPRPIPEEVPWYGKPMNIIPCAGLLSFGSIFIELYYVLTSLWNYKFYHVYGFLLGVYAILSIVVSMTTIIVVYFCLNAENYLWQWISLASGGSTAVYVFLYGVYYFMFKTSMSGFLQTVFYFGYMSLISLNLGILCGTIGHFSAGRFVRTIFKNVKVD